MERERPFVEKGQSTPFLPREGTREKSRAETIVCLNSQALLSNFGVNTSQLIHDIGKLPSTEPPKSRRKRHVAQASRVAPKELGGAYGTNEGDVKAWGRNWHETVILSGIEMQRQRVRTAFWPLSQHKRENRHADICAIDGQGLQRSVPAEDVG